MSLSGQKVVTTAGTAVALGSDQIASPLMVKALDTNTGKIFIGNDGSGDVDDTNGFVLLAGELAYFSWIGNMGSIMLDSSVDGEGVSWLQLDA